jgi:hypothetical protein
MTKTALIAEVVVLLILMIAVNWLSATVLGTKSFGALTVFSLIYLVVRGLFLARKMRA